MASVAGKFIGDKGGGGHLALPWNWRSARWIEMQLEKSLDYTLDSARMLVLGWVFGKSYEPDTDRSTAASLL
jgi:hypothetical protein